jgi:hypothetical protein
VLGYIARREFWQKEYPMVQKAAAALKGKSLAPEVSRDLNDIAAVLKE